MCVTSAVLGYGMTVPTTSWATITWDEYNKLLDKARRWDELSNQPHCEDPEKEKWMLEVEDRLERLETSKKDKKKSSLL